MTIAPVAPATAVTEILDGQLVNATVGTAIAITVTVKEQLAVALLHVVAAQFTVVVPIGNALPLAVLAGEVSVMTGAVVQPVCVTVRAG